MSKYIISSLVILFLTSANLEAEISKVFEFTNNELENLMVFLKKRVYGYGGISNHLIYNIS